MKICKRCTHIKDWGGDNIKCPFKNGDVFSDNWNCVLINKIRDLCEIAMDGKDYRLHYQYCDDQKYAAINTSDIPYDEDNDVGLGTCLWVTWYKSRGRTDQMWILGEYDEPKKPTFRQLSLVVSYYTEEGVLKA